MRGGGRNLNLIRSAGRRRPAILALFLLSGASGLIYQAVWFRLAATLFGATVPAAATVLAAFMSGLALGSYLLGRGGDRSARPLRLYAGYELGIAVAALAALLAMEQMRPLAVLLSNALGAGGAGGVGGGGVGGVGLAAARFTVAFLVMLIPTTLMGATLPILSRALVRNRAEAGLQLSGLYAANTWGAALGALAAGFLLIRLLGLRGTVLAAAALNAAVAGGAWWLQRRSAAATPLPPPAAATPLPAAGTANERRWRAALLATFAAAGATTLAYEVLWSRILHALVGNSTYAFATTLVVFLAGIALGGWLVRYVLDRVPPLRLYAALQAGIAAAALLSVPLLTRGVDLRAVQGFFAAGAVPPALELAVRFAASAAVLLIPTTLMGAAFPLVARLYLSHPSRAGAEVGVVYAAGTAGNIAGALLAGFLLVPLAGLTRSLALAALINAALAVAVLLLDGRPPRVTGFFAVAGGGGLALVGAAAAVAAAGPTAFQFPADTEAPGDVVLFYREGITATTKVYEKPLTARKHMSVDGIYVGGAGGAEKKEQVLAHLPKLLLPRYRSELAIGLGSGVVPGESGRHPAIERLDVVEIAASVAAGAAWFERENHAILHDPRVRLVVADGMHYLATSAARYDVIASDAKSRPKARGNGLFYSREYYALVRERLTPEGLFIQWVPLHLPRRVYESVLRTFAAGFPHATLWVLPDRDSFLVGSRRALEPDWPLIAARLRAPPAAEDPFAGLRKHGVEDAASVAAMYVAERAALLAATAGAPVNSLNRPHVEFYAFADYARSANGMIADNYKLLLALRAAAEAEVPPPAKAAHRAVSLYLQALGAAYALERDLAAVEEPLAEALRLAPGNALLRALALDYYATRVRGRLRAGDAAAAQRYLAAAREVGGAAAQVHRLAALLHLHAGDPAAAEAALLAAVRASPGEVALRTALVRLLWQRGAADEAAGHLQAVLAAAPDSTFAHRNLGLYLARRRGDPASALPHLQAAYARMPRDADLIGALAWARSETGDQAGARAVIRAGRAYHRGNPRLTAERSRILTR